MALTITNAEHISYCSDIGYNYFVREKSISRHFGKSIHDMIYNSKFIRAQVESDFPELSKEAERFEIYQHMSFLLSCPSNYDRKEDSLYGEVRTYIKKHMIAGVKSPCFSMKDKMKLLGVAFFPVTMSRIVEKKASKSRRKR